MNRASKPTAAVPAKAVERSVRNKQPTGWDDIAVGAIVLAAFSREHAEWYECVVLAVEGKDTFKLRYCDWPNEPTFTRSRGELALIPPAYPLELPLEPTGSAAVA